MIKIGITGGIGSGKTVVSELFRLHKIPVYDADTQVKQLNDNSEIVRQKIVQHFGSELYINGILDKKRFAEIIFQDKKQLEIATNIIHAELKKHLSRWFQEKNKYPVVAMDAPVLFESNFHKFMDYNITVTAPEEMRLSRTIKRDNTDAAHIKRRMANQMSDSEKIKLSDFVILNDNRNSLIKQTEDILSQIGILTDKAPKSFYRFD